MMGTTTEAAAELGPLALTPKLDSRIWGGERLAPLLALREAPRPLAEVWQVHEDRPVASGPHQGRTLKALCEVYGAALLGRRAFARYGPVFPLLTKLIDARADLSIQVHPDDARAREKDGPGAFGKSEAWYILDADPGVALWHGFRHALDAAAFRAALADGSVMEHLRRVPIRAGDALMVPAGTIHAITAGTLLFEVQQRSETTYRVYDYDRVDADGKKRPLHVDDALRVMDFRAGGPLPVHPPEDEAVAELARCPHFLFERLRVSGDVSRATHPDSFEILCAAGAPVTLRWRGGTVLLAPGSALVLPANLGPYGLHAAGPANVLRCALPHE